MQVLIVNTSELTGGAAVAANRLKDALNNNGVTAKMLVRDRQTDDKDVITIKKGWRTHWNLLWERWCIFWHLHFKKSNLFAIDIANAGTDITKMEAFKAADVIHLSWVNQGMLSLGNIRKILRSGKPVVWTMHDLWPASSICHYAHGCDGFKMGCGNCPLLPKTKNDLSARIYKRKKNMYKGKNLSFVACSEWLAGQARESGLITDQSITSIPNPIDSSFFCPNNKIEAKKQLNLPTDKRIILFVSQRVTDKRKGMEYFVEAISKLSEQYPEMKNTTEIAILGGHAEELVGKLALKVNSLGYVNDLQKIRLVYSASDVFVLPSLEDNLPNTIMEALACGIPCVGFSVGGIPEMIEHTINGYVAASKDSTDLASGIHWVLEEADYQKLSGAAVEKVQACYSQKSVAERYIEVYEKALSNTHYAL